MQSLLNTEETVRKLVSQWGYPESGARKVAIMLSQLRPALAMQVAQWWESGKPVQFEVEGCDVESLKAEHGMNEIAAILTLDWLLRDPAPALAQLGRGHDQVR